MPNAEHLSGLRNKTPRQLLVDNIARDVVLLHRHERENGQALAEEKHPDFYFANSKAGVISRRLCENIQKAFPKKAHATDAASRLLDKYSKAAEAYGRNAKRSKPEGLASMSYGDRAKVVEANRKDFERRILRNRMLEEAANLTGRIPGKDANPSLLAKMHAGIGSRLLNAASYTHYLGDGGTGQVPTMEELMRKAKYHESKGNAFTKQVLREKQEKMRGRKN